MNQVSIIHNPRCSKSRQTLALLEQHNIHPEVIEYLKTPLTEIRLREIIKMLGIEPRALLRKNETDYKELGLKDVNLSDDELITAMCQHPKLIERPIVICNEKAKIGRPPETVLELL
jgi:arsenate reductase